MAFLYNFGLYNLLIDSIIDIACFVFLIKRYESFVIMAIGISRKNIDGRFIVAVSTRFFLGYLLGLGSQGAIFFIDGFFIDYFSKSVAFYLDLLIKSLLAIITYLI